MHPATIRHSCPVRHQLLHTLEAAQKQHAAAVCAEVFRRHPHSSAVHPRAFHRISEPRRSVLKSEVFSRIRARLNRAASSQQQNSKTSDTHIPSFFVGLGA